MPNIIGSVIQAAGSAVAKVFVIAALGYGSVFLPKENPLIPINLIGKISRFSFNLFTLSLIYTTMAKSISLDTISYLWFIVVSGFVVISTSFLTATAIERIPTLRIENGTDFKALRIAASFPNIVALPILIFPALCEYEVVYEAFSSGDKSEMTSDEMYDDCVDQSNQMIFVYFFSWNLMFWTVGNQLLVSAGEEKQETSLHGNLNSQAEILEGHYTLKNQVVGGLKSVFTSSGFFAMLLGFVTAIIIPLQKALFEPAGWFRFLGSALESLAAASPSLGTIIVAASLVQVPPKESERSSEPRVEYLERSIKDNSIEDSNDESHSVSSEHMTDGGHDNVEQEQISVDRQSELSLSFYVRSSIRSSIKVVSDFVVQTIRSPSITTHIWFNMSKLVVSPAIICCFIIALDCTGTLVDINPLAKLVVLLNAALPGALIVVIVLQSRELTETASVVAEVYFSSYIISIFTIAFWASVGLYISIPDEDGSSFCYSK